MTSEWNFYTKRAKHYAVLKFLKLYNFFIIQFKQICYMTLIVVRINCNQKGYVQIWPNFEIEGVTQYYNFEDKVSRSIFPFRRIFAGLFPL